MGRGKPRAEKHPYLSPEETICEGAVGGKTGEKQANHLSIEQREKRGSRKMLSTLVGPSGNKDINQGR